MNVIRLVLFDLDGTLLDTAPDLLYALNHLRAEQHLPPLPLSAIRPIANLGSKAMIKKALNINAKAGHACGKAWLWQNPCRFQTGFGRIWRFLTF